MILVEWEDDWIWVMGEFGISDIVRKYGGCWSSGWGIKFLWRKWCGRVNGCRLRIWIG